MAMDKIEIGGIGVDEVYNRIQMAGVSKSDAVVLVADWILHNAGRSRRTFEFVTPFTSVDAACVSAFARAFRHSHWIDGQSVVQAEETTTEQGFNTRFDNITSDIDGLAREIAKSFACLSQMRRDVRALLDELRAEVNRINNDVYNCCLAPQTITPASIGDLRAIDRTDFLGTTKFFDKPVSVWKTSQGTIVLPVTLGPTMDPTTDPRIKRPGALGRFIEETPEVRTIFGGGPVTKERFVDALGEMRTKEGFTVKDLVKILPDRQAFPTPEAMLTAVTEREAAALRTSGDTAAVLAGTFGVGTTVTSVGAASVDRLDIIPAAVRGALVASGVDTIEKLAAVNPRELSVRLGRAGVETPAADVASWSATAKTLVKI